MLKTNVETLLSLRRTQEKLKEESARITALIFEISKEIFDEIPIGESVEIEGIGKVRGRIHPRVSFTDEAATIQWLEGNCEGKFIKKQIDKKEVEKLLDEWTEAGATVPELSGIKVFEQLIINVTKTKGE